MYFDKDKRPCPAPIFVPQSSACPISRQNRCAVLLYNRALHPKIFDIKIVHAMLCQFMSACATDKQGVVNKYAPI